jgi:hypothetical protein
MIQRSRRLDSTALKTRLLRHSLDVRALIRPLLIFNLLIIDLLK